MPSAAPPALALPAGIDERTVFRSLFGAYPDALLVVEHTGRIVMANPAAADLLGYTCEELVGLSVDALVPEPIRPRHAVYRQGYERAPRARPMGTQMDLVAKHKDGSEVMVEIALSPLQGHGLPLVVAAIRGIGAYPRVQEALLRARYSEYLARFGRQAVDARESGILMEIAPVIAADALQVPLAMVVVLDADRQEFRVASGVGLLVGEEVGARLGARPDAAAGQLLLQGDAITIEDYRSESRFDIPAAYLEAGLVSALAVPLYDRGRVIGTLAVRSPTVKRFGNEEKRFLESLSSLLSTSLQRTHSEEALNHAQRLESVGQLTGGIAHDFNNLLTVIQGNLQILEELPSLQGDDLAPEMLAAAARASRRAAELTGKLLAFSRRQVLQPTVIDLAALLRSLVDMLRRTLDQRVRIAVQMPSDCPMVVADPGQLESALLNIAINARDAMPHGGTLTFHVDVCRSLPPSVCLELDDANAVPSRFVTIAISDTGCGMSEQVRARAFEPFFTTKDKGRGTGLGLSTVYGFVKQSRGAISIDSTLLAGTTLTLYLPRGWASAAGADDARDHTADLPTGLRILLVEDDLEVSQVVRDFLTALGCVVTQVSSGEQALVELKASMRFDLVLSDIALGAGMRGTTLVQHVRQFCALPVLLMSGYSADVVNVGENAGVGYEVLAKPFTREQLSCAIARALGDRGTEPA